MPKSSAWVDCYRWISPATFLGRSTDVCLLLVLLYHIRLYVSIPFLKLFCNFDFDRPTWTFKSLLLYLNCLTQVYHFVQSIFKSEYCTKCSLLFCSLCTKYTITYFFNSPYIERTFQKYRSKTMKSIDFTSVVGCRMV